VWMVAARGRPRESATNNSKTPPRSEYVLVRGGSVKLGLTKKTAMQTISGWEKTVLFKKPKGKSPTIDKYPGVLQDDWAFFPGNMSPGDLMKQDQFLIDRQHTWVKQAPTPKQKGRKKA
jgi:hypothetical protein